MVGTGSWSTLPGHWLMVLTLWALTHLGLELAGVARAESLRDCLESLDGDKVLFSLVLLARGKTTGGLGERCRKQDKHNHSLDIL